MLRDYLPVLAVLLAAGFFFARRSRKRALRERLLADWGRKPAEVALEEDLLKDLSDYHNVKRIHEPPLQPVDDLTWQDLDMDRVFSGFNLCRSTLGGEVLYDMLRDTGTPEETLARRIELIHLFQDDAPLRADLQMTLTKAGRSFFHGAARYLYEPGLHALRKPWLYYAAGLAPLAVLAAGFLYPPLFLLLIPVFGMNAVIHFKSNLRYHAQFVAMEHFGRVLNVSFSLARLERKPLEPELGAVRALLKPLRRVNRLLSSLKTDEMMSRFPIDLRFLWEFRRIFFLSDAVAYCRVSARVLSRMPELRALYRRVGELDALVAAAAYLHGRAWCSPDFMETLGIQAAALAHPLLENPVANDFTWLKNTLITGSNASGKSTFIKALAVNAILAQTLGFCRAERFSLCRSRVMTAMAVRDHLVKGVSYYVAEIQSLRRILDAVDSRGWPVLCMVDEILRGTNTVERIAASCAILESFAGKNLLCINATHDIELTGLLKDSFENYHFRDELDGEGMRFSYLLREGPASSRNAIRLLSFLGFEQDIISRAEQVAGQLESRD